MSMSMELGRLPTTNFGGWCSCQSAHEITNPSLTRVSEESEGWFCVCMLVLAMPWHDAATRVSRLWHHYYCYDYVVAPTCLDDYPLRCFLFTTRKLIVGEWLPPSYHRWCVGVLWFKFHVLQLLASRFKVVLQYWTYDDAWVGSRLPNFGDDHVRVLVK
jgi:hypothetical protein